MRRLQLEEQIKKAEHPAPIDGVVAVAKGKLGETIQRGTPIARIYDDRDLMIRFAVPKEHRNLVKIGGRVELSVPGIEQPVWATIERVTDQEPPINFAVVDADIDDSKLRPDEIQVASEGRVRIADAQQPAAGAKR